MVLVAAGCATRPEKTPALNQDLQVAEAKAQFLEGDWFKAKQTLHPVLIKNPDHSEAQVLMAQILDAEISRHKEAFDEKLREELTQEEKLEEARLWMDRAQSFLELGQYEEALFCAEKVFLYDSSSPQASQLIDKIRNQAVRKGKDEVSWIVRMKQEEIGQRIQLYRQTAEEALQEGRWGMAQLAVEKLLLLNPEDSEGLRLYDEIKQHLTREAA